MDITLLIQSLLGLISLLAILMFLLLYNFRGKTPVKIKEETSIKKNEGEDITLPGLRKIIRNSHSTTKELEDALNLVLKYYGDIHPKLGVRTHPDFDNYSEILFTIARHKHINKDLILKFDKELERRNPEYKKEISDALMRGLNSRGI